MYLIHAYLRRSVNSPGGHIRGDSGRCDHVALDPKAVATMFLAAARPDDVIEHVTPHRRRNSGPSETDRFPQRHTNRHADRHTDRHPDRMADRYTNRHSGHDGRDARDFADAVLGVFVIAPSLEEAERRVDAVCRRAIAANTALTGYRVVHCEAPFLRAHPVE